MQRILCRYVCNVSLANKPAVTAFQCSADCDERAFIRARKVKVTRAVMFTFSCAPPALATKRVITNQYVTDETRQCGD